MKLNVYGRKVEIIRSDNRWKVYYFGYEGKKRIANDIVVPSAVKQNELISYIEDLCHEWVTSKNSKVFEIK